jgi:gamma-glutamyltranspeptidase / glutathione hydrolase
MTRSLFQSFRFIFRGLLGGALGAVMLAGAAQAGGSGSNASKFMVAAADERAVEAGLAALHAGGTAMDAAVAVQLMLNLVEPQNSGIGGGAFLLYYDAASGRTFSYDGRETAPAAAGPDLFLTADGEPMGFYEALVGGRAVGVPGTLRLLEQGHAAHGRRPWAELFDPTIALAETGFAISPKLARSISRAKELGRYETTRRYFFDANGAAKRAGTILKNPEFAATLREIAQSGADAFYTGPLARDIVAAVRGVPDNPGLMTEVDLAAYAAKPRDPVCSAYRAWTICGMGPPTSGGLTVLQILGLLEPFDLAASGPGSLESIHLVSEASRLAYADRGRYMADSDFVQVPVAGLIDKAYLRERASLIQSDRAMAEVAAGIPPGAEVSASTDDGRLPAWALAPAPPPATESLTTTHFSIVDGDGNAVAMTSSIEQAFGSRLMVRGFLLNQQLTDFSFRPTVDGEPVANRVESGKRPRSSMSPTLVFDADGQFAMTLGSPGGPLIITYVVETLIASLDWGLAMQPAISLPRHSNWRGPVALEAGTPLASLEAPLAAMGHEVQLRDFHSNLQGIRRVPGGYEGGSDPRGEGVARGD